MTTGTLTGKTRRTLNDDLKSLLQMWRANVLKDEVIRDLNELLPKDRVVRYLPSGDLVYVVAVDTNPEYTIVENANASTAVVPTDALEQGRC